MMTQPSHFIRWLTLAGTILTQFALGSVYTWSLFNGPLAQKLGQPIIQVAFAFGLLSLAMAVASTTAGKFQERFGVRKVTIGAGLLLGVGLCLTGWSSSLTMLWLCTGILVGLADGIGYLLTLSNCVKWFPERKGVISACAIGAYGLGSLGFKYINSQLLAHSSLESTFALWGAIALLMVVSGAMMMKDAPRQDVRQQSAVRDYTLAESMRMPQYWLLALMFVTAFMSGLYVIGVAKDIGENLVHLTTAVAANAVTIIAIANLSGRLVLGVLSDRMSRIRVVSLAQVIAMAGMAMLLFVHLNETLFFLSLACVAFSFGGTITVYPSLVSDFFGLNNLTKNYGIIYLGFGIGSIIGSLVASLFGGFMVTFQLIAVLLVIALIISLTLRQPGDDGKHSYRLGHAHGD
ncbi:MFS transporter [Candidatus Sodalis endolongispinus]|uniref:MFS transporter n=1 Tax=Candidatus Sodalis endolongispinus TaxID=2812662 RepID=A0ABS5YBT9_9GAMM|nr:MFS transporter [Candidatus Sodalis endolongispinus]MBT9432490.1 MFS transporter [Candidatus Sodalis endolongispinus]